MRGVRKSPRHTFRKRKVFFVISQQLLKSSQQAPSIKGGACFLIHMTYPFSLNSPLIKGVSPSSRRGGLLQPALRAESEYPLPPSQSPPLKRGRGRGSVSVPRWLCSVSVPCLISFRRRELALRYLFRLSEVVARLLALLERVVACTAPAPLSEVPAIAFRSLF